MLWAPAARDLHDVITSVTMIRPHQGLGGEGRRRVGGTLGIVQERMKTESWSDGKSTHKKKAWPFPAFLFFIFLTHNLWDENIFVFGYSNIPKSWQLNGKRMLFLIWGRRFILELKDEIIDRSGEVSFALPLLSGCSLYSLREDGAPLALWPRPTTQF